VRDGELAATIGVMSAPPPSAPPTVLSRVLPAERLLFAGDVVCAGTFACGVDDPLFEGGEPSTAHCIVFSQTPVWIQHDGGRRYVADPTRVTFHNRGRAYRRWQIDARGDRCRWIAFAEDVALAAIDRVDPDCVDRSPGAPFRFQFMTAPALVYLRQHRFFRALDSRDGASRLEVEETSLNLLHEVV
jgi:hypothetical protein